MSNGRRRLFNIILVCSLAINLLLLGGIIGRFAFGPPRPPRLDHLGWVVRNLDKSTRRELRPELVAHARKMMPLRRQIRAAQQQFEEVLLQPKLDPARLDAALARLRAASDTYQHSMHNEMVVILKKMNLQERQRFVYFLRHRPDIHHRPRHRENRGERYGGPSGDNDPPPQDRTPPSP